LGNSPTPAEGSSWGSWLVGSQLGLALPEAVSAAIQATVKVQQQTGRSDRDYTTHQAA
jgi:hypothetical protein